VALFKHYYTLVPAVALLIVGVFFGLAAIIACCAMFNHNKCLLTVVCVCARARTYDMRAASKCAVHAHWDVTVRHGDDHSGWFND
jgi:hypothetical protein